jgi:BolA protein
MNVQETIEQKVRQRLSPSFLLVENESHRHGVPPGSESHFKLTVVSADFENQSLVARHRMLNETLAAEFAAGLHALALHTYTPGEWNLRQGSAPESPPCLGGSKAG